MNGQRLSSGRRKSIREKYCEKNYNHDFQVDSTFGLSYNDREPAFYFAMPKVGEEFVLVSGFCCSM
jgi:hypothetical protein